MIRWISVSTSCSHTMTHFTRTNHSSSLPSPQHCHNLWSNDTEEATVDTVKQWWPSTIIFATRSPIVPIVKCIYNVEGGSTDTSSRKLMFWTLWGLAFNSTILKMSGAMILELWSCYQSRAESVSPFIRIIITQPTATHINQPHKWSLSLPY